jgi:hypothetical protein
MLKCPEYTREKHFIDLTCLNDRIESELYASPISNTSQMLVPDNRQKVALVWHSQECNKLLLYSLCFN